MVATACGAALSSTIIKGLRTSGQKVEARKAERENPSRKERATQNTLWCLSQMIANRSASLTMHRAAREVVTGSMFVGCVDVAKRIPCGSTIRA